MEQLEVPPTFKDLCSTARRNGHVLYFGARFEVDIDYAVSCTSCGAHAVWLDPEAKEEFYGVFAQVWDKPCGAQTQR